MCDVYKVVNYKYKKKKVFVTLQNQSFTKKDLHHIVYEIVDYQNVGPDTWMEGDIGILDEDLHKYTPNDLRKITDVELVVEVAGFI